MKKNKQVQPISTDALVTLISGVLLGGLGILSGYQQLKVNSLKYNRELVKSYIRRKQTFPKPFRFFGEYFERKGEDEFISVISRKKYPEIRLCYKEHLTGKSKLENCVYANFSGSNDLRISTCLIDELGLSDKYKDNDFFIKCMKDVKDEDGKAFIVLENWYLNPVRTASIIKKLFDCGVFIVVTASEKEHIEALFKETGSHRVYYLDYPKISENQFPQILSSFLEENIVNGILEEKSDIDLRDIINIATINSDYGMKGEDLKIDLKEYVLREFREANYRKHVENNEMLLPVIFAQAGIRRLK